MSKTLKGIKVKLIPNNKQKALFIQAVGTRRFAYNWVLDKQMKAFINKEKLKGANELCRELVQLKNTDEYNWLKDISCDIPKQAIKDCCGAYERFFKEQKKPNYIKFTKKTIKRCQLQHRAPTFYDMNRHPKFKKKCKCLDSFHNDCMHVQFTSDKVFIAKIGWVKLAQSNKFPLGKSGKDFKICNAKVSTDGEDWYFSGSFEVASVNKLTANKPKTNYGIGSDLGIKDLAICSDNSTYKNINKSKRVKQLEKRKRRIQRRISKKYLLNQQGNKYIKTNNILKYEYLLLKINHKLTNIRHNYTHQVTSSIIKRNPIFICIEDLNISGIMKNKHLSKAIQNQNLYEFRRQITYKCDWNNIDLVIADRYYPSSKTCIKCGYINKDLKLKHRTYKCPICGNIIDRDYQASLNLKQYGERYLNLI